MPQVQGYLIIEKKNGTDGKPHPVDRTLKLGRGPTCDVRVHVQSVSLEHCVIIIEPGRPVSICNLSETSPTLLNEVSIGSKKCELRHGDYVSLGQRRFRWEYIETSPFYRLQLNSMRRKSDADAVVRHADADAIVRRTSQPIAVVLPMIHSRRTLEPSIISQVKRNFARVSAASRFSVSADAEKAQYPSPASKSEKVFSDEGGTQQAEGKSSPKASDSSVFKTPRKITEGRKSVRISMTPQEKQPTPASKQTPKSTSAKKVAASHAQKRRLSATPVPAKRLKIESPKSLDKRKVAALWGIHGKSTAAIRSEMPAKLGSTAKKSAKSAKSAPRSTQKSRRPLFSEILKKAVARANAPPKSASKMKMSVPTKKTFFSGVAKKKAAEKQKSLSALTKVLPQLNVQSTGHANSPETFFVGRKLAQGRSSISKSPAGWVKSARKSVAVVKQASPKRRGPLRLTFGDERASSNSAAPKTPAKSPGKQATRSSRSRNATPTPVKHTFFANPLVAKSPLRASGKLSTPKSASPKATTPKAATPRIATPKAVTPKAATPKAATPKAATPKAATPKAATPKAATPRIATPKAVSPKAATPKAATPKAATPKAATPKAATPKAATPKAATPKAATPKAATPKAATPKAVTPKAVTPKAATPKAVTPKAATPKAASPRAATPKAATPKVATPKATTPKVVALKAATPKATTPRAATPKTVTPKAATPKATTPKAAIPKATTPKDATPKATTPRIATPKAATPRIATSRTATPRTATPKTVTPNAATPKAATPKATTPKSATPKAATPKTAKRTSLANPLVAKSPLRASRKLSTLKSASPKAMTPKAGTPKAAKPRSASPAAVTKAITPKMALPMACTAKVATPKSATIKVATPEARLELSKSSSRSSRGVGTTGTSSKRISLPIPLRMKTPKMMKRASLGKSPKPFTPKPMRLSSVTTAPDLSTSESPQRKSLGVSPKPGTLKQTTPKTPLAFTPVAGPSKTFALKLETPVVAKATSPRLATPKPSTSRSPQQSSVIASPLLEAMRKAAAAPGSPIQLKRKSVLSTSITSTSSAKRVRESSPEGTPPERSKRSAFGDTLVQSLRDRMAKFSPDRSKRYSTASTVVLKSPLKNAPEISANLVTSTPAPGHQSSILIRGSSGPFSGSPPKSAKSHDSSRSKNLSVTFSDILVTPGHTPSSSKMQSVSMTPENEKTSFDFSAVKTPNVPREMYVSSILSSPSKSSDSSVKASGSAKRKSRMTPRETLTALYSDRRNASSSVSPGGYVDVKGIKRLTTAPIKSPTYLAVEGVKRLFGEAKALASDSYTSISGVRELFASPSPARNRSPEKNVGRESVASSPVAKIQAQAEERNWNAPSHRVESQQPAAQPAPKPAQRRKAKVPESAESPVQPSRTTRSAVSARNRITSPKKDNLKSKKAAPKSPARSPGRVEPEASPAEASPQKSKAGKDKHRRVVSFDLPEEMASPAPTAAPPSKRGRQAASSSQRDTETSPEPKRSRRAAKQDKAPEEAKTSPVKEKTMKRATRTKAAPSGSPPNRTTRAAKDKTSRGRATRNNVEVKAASPVREMSPKKDEKRVTRGRKQAAAKTESPKSTKTEKVPHTSPVAKRTIRGKAAKNEKASPAKKAASPAKEATAPAKKAAAPAKKAAAPAKKAASPAKRSTRSKDEPAKVPKPSPKPSPRRTRQRK